MAESSKIERRQVHYSGSVQGVGFRHTAWSLAKQFPVDGFVRNLRDGRVHIIVEGEVSQLDRLLEAIAERMGRYIRDIQVDSEEATGEFEGFDIRF